MSPRVRPLGLDQVLDFNSGLRAFDVGAAAVFLIGERDRFVLSDAREVDVARLIDGKRTVGDVVRAASRHLPEVEALYILNRLTARGHLTPVVPARTREGAAFWHGVGVGGEAIAGALRKSVSVRSLGDPAHASFLSEALRQAGLRVDGQSSSIEIVVTDDYLRPELDFMNRTALARKTPWVLLKAVGTRPLIGPFFAPETGPCWECLAFWMRSNRPVEELVRRHRMQQAPVSPPPASIEASVRAACGVAAIAVARAFASDAPERSLHDGVLALDLASLETSVHAVVKRPQCPVCGDPGRTAAIGARRVEIQPIAKDHFEDGGYRRQSPRQTYDRYKHLVSPITGAVSYLVPAPGRDTELRAVYASGYLACPRGGIPATNVFDRGCAGKGRSADQAKVSALCEALERYSGVYQGDEARVRASKGELGAAARAPNELLGFSDAQVRSRSRARPADAREEIPEPFDVGAVIDWALAWSVTRDERRYVPFTYCYGDAPAECGTAFCRSNGNGVAAGTCVEEALLQGLLELVERDAAAIWWYCRVRRPEIDLRSFGDPYFDALHADYARRGWSVWVLDLTHDLGIPTCVALAHEPKEDRFSIGFGCHLEPRLAVQRSLTELNQLFDPAASRRAPWDIDRVAVRDYLFPDPGRLPVTARELRRAGGDDLRADIEDCVRRLEGAGLELIVVDKTRPDIGLHVIQSIVPGLRHFWPRFGPGRLYDVPHALGWVPRPLGENELNPVPLFV